MKRNLEKHLQAWLDRPAGKRKPLILRGARQVGKSTLVRRFAKARGMQLHEVNLERLPRLREVFSTLDMRRILEELEYEAGQGKINGPRSLLFLDEIQGVPEALQSLRYFFEDLPHLPVIAAGSLLEFALSDHAFSMPVGRVEYCHMGPLTFTEYLDARNEARLLSLMENHVVDARIPESAHRRLLTLLREYLLVGGMPEAVKNFLDTEDFSEAFQVQHSILDTYRDDFSKYARGKDLFRLHRILDYLPRGAGEKIKYVNLDPHTQAKDLRKTIDLLTRAGVALKATHSDASGIPLVAGSHDRVFKLYALDVGLFNRGAGLTRLTVDQLADIRFVNEGNIAEQFIAQHLHFNRVPYKAPALYYWLREGRSTNAEVDFLLQIEDRIVPVEVKAGKSGTLKSLLQFHCEKSHGVSCRFDANPPSLMHVSHRLKQKDRTVPIDFTLLSLPLYMVDQTERLLREAFGVV